MTEPLKILGIVGARSGSKSLPNKNILPVFGKPMIAWIIEAARRSKYITRVVISTDSPEYAEIGKTYGAEAPFLRPKELSEDLVPDFDWIHHAAVWLKENEGWQADIIMRLPPTSPLCTTEDIDACVKMLIDDPNADTSYTFVPMPKHPYKTWRIRDDGYAEPFFGESVTGMKDAFNKPRQILPKAYYYIDSSAIRWKTLVDNQSLAGKNNCYRIIDEAVDIDVTKDLEQAEEILRIRAQDKTSNA